MLVMLLLLLTTEILLTSYKPGGPGLDCHHQYKKACLTLRFAPWSIICLNQNLPKWNMKGNLISKTVIEKLPGSHITTGGHHGPHEWTTSYRWFQTSNVWHLPHRWSHPENVKKTILNMISQMYAMGVHGYLFVPFEAGFFLISSSLIFSWSIPGLVGCKFHPSRSACDCKPKANQEQTTNPVVT